MPDTIPPTGRERLERELEQLRTAGGDPVRIAELEDVLELHDRRPRAARDRARRAARRAPVAAHVLAAAQDRRPRPPARAMIGNLQLETELAEQRLDEILETRRVQLGDAFVDVKLQQGLGNLPELEARACALYGRLLSLRGRPVRVFSSSAGVIERLDAAVCALLLADVLADDLELVVDRVLVAVRTASDPRFGGVYFEHADGLVAVDSLERGRFPRRLGELS
jgi:hypothetical protein